MGRHPRGHSRDLRRLSPGDEAARLMQFEVRHITQYRYDEPVRESVVELRMQPRRTGAQNLLTFELEIEPHGQIFSYADSWGNAVHHFDMPQAHDQLDIIARSIIETNRQPSLPDRGPMDDWAHLADEAVRSDCWDFLAPQGVAAETAALRAFIHGPGLDALTRANPLTALKALSRVVFEAFDYEPGIT